MRAYNAEGIISRHLGYISDQTKISALFAGIFQDAEADAMTTAGEKEEKVEEERGFRALELGVVILKSMLRMSFTER